MATSTDLTSLTAERGHIKAALTRFKTFCATAAGGTSIGSLTHRLEANKGLLDKFDKIQVQIESLTQGTEAAETHAREREVFETTYFDLIADVEAYIANSRPQLTRAQANPSAPSPFTTESQCGLKLPVINLPSFDGDYNNWVKFRDTFESLIHTNDFLSGIQKFHYLNSALKGQAARVIQSLGVSETNYALAWKAVKDRYEDSLALVYHHADAILELARVDRDSCNSLRQFIDDANSHVLALRALGEPIDSWDTLIILILSKKLDARTKQEWEKRRINLKEPPKFTEFIAFLEKQCKYLEQVNPVKPLVNKAVSHQKFSRGRSGPPAVNVGSMTGECSNCKGGHFIANCDEFNKASVDERVAIVKRLGACFNCLRTGHSGRECTHNSCRKCGRKHHTLIHLDRRSAAEREAEARKGSPGQSGVALSTSLKESRTTLVPYNVLATAIIHIIGKGGRILKCRAVLDSGSQADLITEDLYKRLGIPGRDVTLSVGGLGNNPNAIKRQAQVQISSRANGFKATLTCYVIPKITDDMPNTPLQQANITVPQGIVLADPQFGKPGKIDLLIGTGLFWDLLCIGQRKCEVGNLRWQKTQLGWILGGTYGYQEQSRPSCHVVTDTQLRDQQLRDQQLRDQLTRFWEIEHVTTTKDNEFATDPAELAFTQTATRDSSGKYIVHIPFTERISELGNSREQAEKRLLALEKKFRLQPALHKEYAGFMDDYETQGHMTMLSEEAPARNSNECFLPHRAVFKASSTTTKIRVVFDGSAKTTSGLSLNDVQRVGPVVQSDLLSIVLRFRQHLFVISADIEKMYRQILVTPEHRRFQRILWRPSTRSPIRAYELNTVTYGTASAPFLATRVLRQIGLDCAQEAPVASRAILNDFYVDDLLTGSDSREGAAQLKVQISEILQRFGFNLRKWASNDTELMNSARRETVEINAERDPKTLGLVWVSETDELRYVVPPPTVKHVTKRIILAEIARIFDPLGLVGPVLVRAKMLMQELWQLQLDWDESVSQEVHSRWTRFREQLQELNNVRIPRHACSGAPGKVELHGFCDASEKAYGACIYMRLKSQNGKYRLRLLCAKSRVAPLKQVTLPRLELCGAVLLAHLSQQVQSALTVGITTVHYWCDSTIVLAWLSASPARWKTYVANRVAEIQRLTNIDEWHHVSSPENPADCLSRGIDPMTLTGFDLWWKGPAFLREPRSTWPAAKGQVIDPPEMRTIRQTLVTVIQGDNDLLERFSSFMRAVRVTAYCHRFARNSRSDAQGRLGGALSTTELAGARAALIKLAQAQSFKAELEALRNGQPLPRGSPLLCLNPFMDTRELLRVGGRLSHAEIPYDQRHPVILPARHRLTDLILEHEHQRLLHAGCQLVLSSLRQRYWPINAKRLIKGVIRRCVRCFRVKPTGQAHIMGDLPASRVTPARPFYNCGVDYAGPYFLKERTRSRVLLKGYLCIFVCFATKAMHLELATDLSTEAFLNCLRRFTSRRGMCGHIYSDNGTNFIGARNELHELASLLDSEQHKEKVARFLNDRCITWHLIPPHAPHFGGLWESGVKSVKYHLKRVIGDQKLTFEELYTLLVQVEACLNSRPLCPLSDDPSDLHPLTPGHFLIGEAPTALPQSDLTGLNQNRLNRYQLIQQLFQHYWRRWTVEYLHTLQQRGKWQTSVPEKLRRGTMVVIKEDNLPPLKWRLGRIEEVHPGQDSVTRVVSVRTAQGTIRRPVSKICPLPTTDNEDVTAASDEQPEEGPNPAPPTPN